MTRLLILWLLSEGPLHGYRIKKILDEPSLRFWFPLEVGSIYAVIGSLARNGYIASEAVEREGLRPERTRYRITKEGRDHFQGLLRQAWRDLPKIADPVNVALAARSELSEEEVRLLLGERAEALKAQLEEVARMASSAPDPEMSSRRAGLIRAEMEWAYCFLKAKGD